MDGRSKTLMNIIATGVFVTTLFLLLLFWGRWFCNAVLIDNVPRNCLKVLIRPSGLVSGEPRPRQEDFPIIQSQTGLFETNEPNVRFSQVYAAIHKEAVIGLKFGAVCDILAEMAPYRDIDVNGMIYYWYEGKDNCLFFNKTNGLLVYRRTNKIGIAGGETVIEQSEFFAGPNGVSETADASLGRFFDLIAGEVVWNRICLYDKKTRQFYVIDFAEGSVSKGLQLTEGDGREPIAMGRIDKGGYIVMEMWWSPPRVKDANENWKDQNLYLPDSADPNRERNYRPSFNYSARYISLLGKSGRIYQLDTENWLLKDAGYLPFPKSLFSGEGQDVSTVPEKLLAYNVQPILALPVLPEGGGNPRRDIRYLGMCVGAVSREGTSLAAAVFDPNGKLMYRGDTKINEGGSTADTVYAESPGASFWTAIEYFLENLQPPVLSLASFLCADCFEALDGHRAIFVLPNSFVGMLGRYTGMHFDREVFLPLLMGPSLILSVWLAMRIRRDATLIGLTGRAKKWWMIGAIAFGLPAYITYRLTRPKETLVTCENCGKMRRPDMETCHRCGSKWEIPEITAPPWRIIG